MHLEVLIGSNDPKNYPLIKPKITVGSAETSDIVITEPGISRKHVIIQRDYDQVYIIDQGSTNGSFLNEERLVPGKKIELTTFFPLRLGDNVLITLIHEDEIPVPETVSVKIDLPTKKTSDADDRTRQISLKDLSDKAKTKKLINESQKKKKEKTIVKPSAKKKTNFSFLQLLGILILGYAGYYTWFQRPPKEEIKIAKVGEIIESKKLDEVVKPVEVLEPTPLENLSMLINDLKCVNDFEKYLCNTIPNASAEPWGVIQVGSRLNVLIEGSYYLGQASTTLKDKGNEQDIKLLAATLYILNVIPNNLDVNLLKDYSLNFSLFKIEGDSKVPFLSFAIPVIKLFELKETLTPEKIRPIAEQGVSALDFTKEFFKVI